MIYSHDNDDDDDDVDESSGDQPSLAGLGRLARLGQKVAWFSKVGTPLRAVERDFAQDYLDALGFPDAHIAGVADWNEAESCAQNPDWNSDWWEAEEQLSAGLLVEAQERLSEDELVMALTHVTAKISDVVHAAAEAAAARAGITDEGLIQAAAGAATQVCYQVALVLAAEAEESHPFAIKFRLFESGRWPLGVIGGTFNLF